MKNEQLSVLGVSLGQDFQSLLQGYMAGWLDENYLTGEDLQELGAVELAVYRLGWVSEAFSELERWLTSGFIPTDWGREDQDVGGGEAVEPAVVSPWFSQPDQINSHRFNQISSNRVTSATNREVEKEDKSLAAPIRGLEPVGDSSELIKTQSGGNENEPQRNSQQTEAVLKANGESKRRSLSPPDSVQGLQELSNWRESPHCEDRGGMEIEQRGTPLATPLASLSPGTGIDSPVALPQENLLEQPRVDPTSTNSQQTEAVLKANGKSKGRSHLLADSSIEGKDLASFPEFQSAEGNRSRETNEANGGLESLCAASQWQLPRNSSHTEGGLEAQAGSQRRGYGQERHSVKGLQELASFLESQASEDRGLMPDDTTLQSNTGSSFSPVGLTSPPSAVDSTLPANQIPPLSPFVRGELEEASLLLSREEPDEGVPFPSWAVGEESQQFTDSNMSWNSTPDALVQGTEAVEFEVAEESASGISLGDVPEMDLDLILEAVAREVNREYRRFYGD